MYLSTQIPASDLPKLLRDGASAAQAPSQCDMLLLSLLTVSGYAMPHYFMRSGKPARQYRPGLMTAVIAPPASGKGIMNLSRRLLHPLHERMRQQTDELLTQASSREEQERVPQRMVFIPGNSSSNALLQILRDNEGRGCILETEMDVITQIWRHDYGNYSTLLRQAFEHETISKARKTKADAYLEVEHPCVNILLSGTLGQLQPLLESRENGLASRLLCYMVSDLIPFDETTIIKHDEEQTNQADAVYARLAKQTTRMYDWLMEQDGECEWRLHPEQAEALRDSIGGNYEATLGGLQMPTTFDPIIKRLSVSVQRIGMILSMLRYFEETVLPRLEDGEKVALPEVLECDERDFRTMLVFSDVLTEHAIGVHALLPASETEFIAIPAEGQAEAAMRLLNALPEQFATKDAVEEGKSADISERSVRNYIKWLLDNKQIKKIGHGKYIKTA